MDDMEMDMRAHRYGHMLHEHLVERVRHIMIRRRERLNALRSRSDAEKYVAYVRSEVQKSFGPFPQRTPLHARVTGQDLYRRYRLEKIVFESRPGLLVTGNIYVPVNAVGKCPGVLVLCGHAAEGKAYVAYQQICQLLALNGFVVFIVDPISQGERRQFYRRDSRPIPDLCMSHNLMGNQMLLVGDFFGSWRVWDAMRSLDYLLSRPDVDPSHVGVTGSSGGGTLTTYLTALDPRLTMAAPCCYICSWLANLENEQAADAEQNPPGLIAAGLDEADLLLCYAPRPTLIVATKEDFFDERYARRAHRDMQTIHSLLGQPSNAGYFDGAGEHGFSAECRRAVASFFMRQAGLKGPVKEGGGKPVDARQLFATPKGEIVPMGSRRVFEFTAQTARMLDRRRHPGKEQQIITAAKRFAHVPASHGKPFYRPIIWAGGVDKTLAGGIQFAVETEPGIQAILTVYGRNPALMHLPRGHVRLFVGHFSSQEDVRNINSVRTLTRESIPLVSVDPRGMGQSFPLTCGSTRFLQSYGSDYLCASTYELLGESLFGRRVFDVMRIMDVLVNGGATRVELIGRGLGSLIVTFAALLHPIKPRVRIMQYLPSYSLLAQTPQYLWPLSCMPHGLLREIDLPDIYHVLGRRLVRSHPWNAMMRSSK